MITVDLCPNCVNDALSFGARPAYSSAMHKLIFKIVPEDLWREAEAEGVFEGASIDLSDGYIHFSTAEQARETAAKHFAGQSDLLIVAVDESRLGNGLKYEAARGGALFPHLYKPLDLSAVVWVKPLALGPDGRHIFPELAE